LATVRVENLTKFFGKLTAVDSINFEVNDGELMCMLGPSGCGKTTTLRMIAGLEQEDEGEIYIDDVPVSGMSPKERDIAMVFQFYAIYPNMKVSDQIAFPLKMRKVPRGEVRRKVKEIAEMLDLDGVLNEVPGRLTMDQKQKVEIGRAIIRGPKVYLFDEPLTNLDTKIRAHMRSELKKLQQEMGVTMIYVTHDQLEGTILADRIAVMNNGTIRQYDSPEMLYEHPTELFVARFIGSPPMNFIDGTLVERHGRVVLDASDLTYDMTDYRGMLEKEINSEMILAIRPEYISLTENNESSFEAKVNIIEPIGERMILNLNIGKYPLKANIRKSKVSSGQKVKIAFDKEHVRLFNKKTEKIVI